MSSERNFFTDTWTKPGEEAFLFWVSFFPTAPLFGVDWRFSPFTDHDFTVSAAKPAPKPAKATTPAPKVADTATAVKKPIAPKPAETATATAKPVETTSKAAEPVVQLAKAEPVKDSPAVVERPKKAAPNPVKASTPVEAPTPVKASTPPAKEAPKPVAADPAKSADDLTLIKGIGPGLEQQLNELGVFKFSQLAEMDKAKLTWLDDNLTTVKGRCFRDDWVGQASALLT